MKNLKEKDLKLKEEELEINPNAEASEADAELSAEELDEVSGGRSGRDSYEPRKELYKELFD